MDLSLPTDRLASHGQPVRLPERARILVIDDSEEHGRLIELFLAGDGLRSVTVTRDPVWAVSNLSSLQPDLVIVDLHMPEMDGQTVVAAVNKLAGPDEHLPVLMMSDDNSPAARKAMLAAGASQVLAKPFDRIEVVLRVRNLLAIRALQETTRRQNERLNRVISAQTEELEQARLETLHHLARVAEYRDDRTHQHTERVGRTVTRLGRQLGVSDAGRLGQASALHDLGKLAVPDAILLKPGPLTYGERRMMERHPVLGAEMIEGSTSTTLQTAQELVLSHHERWDGGGYPYGLAKDAIPLSGRLVAVADVFDAVAHSRPYKPAWPLDLAVAAIADGAGASFDPKVVDAFLELDHAALVAA